MSESPTEHFEHAEHAEHVAHEGDPFMSRVAMTIAVLAVVAAGLGSLETIEEGAAASAKNDAVLFQNKATDQWNFYQAKSVKKNLYEIASTQVPARKDEYEKEAKRYDSESEEILKEAKEQGNKSNEALETSERHEQRHHTLTGAVTFVHVSIAIATIAIITKGQRWPWYTALVLAAAGCVTAALAFR